MVKRGKKKKKRIGVKTFRPQGIVPKGLIAFSECHAGAGVTLKICQSHRNWYERVNGCYRHAEI